MGLRRRTIQAAAWSTGANAIVNLISFARSIFLARWLAVEVFGIYGYAAAITTIAAVVLDFGMGGAFLHRSAQTADEERVARIHFTLKVLIGFVWAGVMISFIVPLAHGDLRIALLSLTGVRAVSILVQTPELILLRRVVHRRLAVIRVVYTVLGTAIALFLAWNGHGLWALLAIEIVSVAVRIVGLLGWRPVWRPHLGWARDVVTYFFRFGRQGLAAEGLAMMLDRLDDLWAGRFLGETALGLYTRSYTFATYPRLLITSSLDSVTNGVYAELKSDRRRLSQAFVRTNALLVRISFFVAGLLALVAPEFIRIVLGSKWMPMLLIFRLMLFFTMLDPLRNTIGSLFVAVGKPEALVQTRFMQLGVLVVGLFTLGMTWDLIGVALAVDLMLIVGMALLLWHARLHVDFSLRQIFALPTAILILAMGMALLVIRGLFMLGFTINDWGTGFIKFIVFAVIYAGMLVIFERERMHSMFNWLWLRKE